MVDINNYSNDLDFCLSTAFKNDSCDELLLEGIDCLENINENEFLNFDSCGPVDSIQQYSSLLPETPPETPINYLNHNSNGSSHYAVFGDSPPRSASNSFTLPSPDSSGLPLLDNGAYSPSSNSNTSSSSSSSSSGISSCHSSHQNLNFALAPSPPTLNGITHTHPHQQAHQILSQPALIIPQSTISPPSIVIPSLVNCQPVLASVDLNGAYQLATTANGTSLVYSAAPKCVDRGKSAIQPIQISPKQAQNTSAASTTTPQHKELLNKNQMLEARKMRNREAALNSRAKKKEYVENLEENVRSLTKERDNLLEENKQLKEKVSDLESRLYNNNSSSSKRPMDINGNYGAVSKRAKMSYFAVAVMLCLQVSPYLIPGGPDLDMGSTLPQQSGQMQRAAMPLQHTGRTLLWKRDTSASRDDSDEGGGLNSIDAAAYTMDGDPRRIKAAGAAASLNSTVYYANMTKSMLCKDYLMNRTESMRLESELRDWFTRFQLEEKQQLLMYRQQLRRHRLNKLAVLSGAAAGGAAGVKGTSEGLPSRKSAAATNKRLLFDSKYVPIPRLKLWMQRQNGDYDDLSEQFDGTGDAGGDGSAKEDRASVESLFGLDYQSLLATIHRRDDTFYYLSYPSKGHLILPPISNRSDVRPRFSFLIPTFHNLSLDEAQQASKNRHRNNSPDAHPSLNRNSSSSNSGGGSGDGVVHPPQMFILQIDCQVINTKVTLINDDRIGNKTAATSAAAGASASRTDQQKKPPPRKAVANNSGQVVKNRNGK